MHFPAGARSGPKSRSYRRPWDKNILPGSVHVTDVEGAQGRVLFVALFEWFRLARRGDSGLIRLGIQGDSG